MSLKILENGAIDRKVFPLRFQSIEGVSLPIRDVSQYIRESISRSSRHIDVIDSSWLFGNNEVVIGMGRPNVYLLIPQEDTHHQRFAAKSLKRGPSKIEPTGGKIQSGLFYILLDLSEEQIHAIKQAAFMEQGSKKWTCVNANMEVLHKAGFTLGNGEALNSYYMPVSFFESVSKYGLLYRGEKVKIEAIKTTSADVEFQIGRVQSAIRKTLIRHTYTGAVGPKAKKENPTPVMVPNEPELTHPEAKNNMFDLEVSAISKLGVHLTRMFGPHTIFAIKTTKLHVDISDYLQNPLVPYKQKERTLVNFLKQRLFSEKNVALINTFLQKSFTTFKSQSEYDLHKMFETHQEGKDNKYNIVVTEGRMMLMKVSIKNKFVDWILTKHVLIANYDKSVLFAGEIWKDEEGVIHINRSSGTYTPTDEQLDGFVEYISKIFPHIRFQKESGV